MKKLKFKLDALPHAEVLTREQLKNVLRSSVGGTGGGSFTCLCGAFGTIQATCSCTLTFAQCCAQFGGSVYSCNHC